MVVDGGLGSVAVDYALEVAGPDQQIVFASHNIPAEPNEQMKR